MKEAQARTTYLKDYRAPDFLIDSTELDFDLYEDHATVKAKLSLRRNPDSNNQHAPLQLHGQELELQQLLLNGEVLSPDRFEENEEFLTIEKVPDTFILESVVQIMPHENTSLEGLYKSKKMFCTQCEAEGFRKITWYLDRPDVLSSFKTKITADKTKYPVLLSNGNQIDHGNSPDGDNRHFAVWEDPFKKPSYLFALVAGDLEPVEDKFNTCSGREIKLQIYVEAKDLDKCDFAMRSLKKAMNWDEEVYGREYDLDIFMIVAVDDFNMGAMENKGLNIFNSSCVLANPSTSTDFSFQRIEAIVAHEYFHNWSGNRVTCRDWFQLSLKEGFTVFRDSEFSADMGSRSVKRVEDVSFLRTYQFAEDAGPMAHSVRPESYMEISNFYTVTIYEKGAEVVRMIARLLGPELFRKGTDRYFDKFDGMAVTTEDFVKTMEEVSGQDLTQFRRWYTQAGTPELKISGEYKEASRSYQLTVEQSCPATPGQAEKLSLFIPLDMALLDSQGHELPLFLEGEKQQGQSTLVLPVTESTQTFNFLNVPEKPVPSLLRSFSAPVKLNMHYSRDELMFLMSHDTDGFVKWESSQQLALDVFNELLSQYQSGDPLELDQRLIDAIRHVLRSTLDDQSLDKAMVANLILLPSEVYIAELATQIDVDGIHFIREYMRHQIAAQLEQELSEVYEKNSIAGEYQVNAKAVARRSLKNTTLTYLALNDDAWVEKAYQQYNNADNMTDVSAGLRALINSDRESSQALESKALDEFYQQWKNETLVVEQWLSMQCSKSSPDNLSKVKSLMQHEAFEIKNPNKARSVISAFCSHNPVGFHQLNGEGYEFLTEQVLILNKLNPQIASRLLTPLTRWKKHIPERQLLMKQQLQRIIEEPELSKDVYEIASKSLA